MPYSTSKFDYLFFLYTLYTLKQEQISDLFVVVAYHSGQGSAQAKIFGLEALANQHFSRGTGEPLDSEEMTHLCACCQ